MASRRTPDSPDQSARGDLLQNWKLPAIRVLALGTEILEPPEVRSRLREGGCPCSVRTVCRVGELSGFEAIWGLYDVILVDCSDDGGRALDEFAPIIALAQRPPVLMLYRSSGAAGLPGAIRRGVESFLEIDPAGHHMESLPLLMANLAVRHRREVACKGMELWIGRLERERRAIFESSHSLITCHGLDTRIIWSSAGPAQGREEGDDDLIGRFCNELWRMGGDAGGECPIAFVLENGERSEAVVMSLDGRRLLQRASAVRNAAGDIVGAIASTLDMGNLARVAAGESVAPLALVDSPDDGEHRG